MATSLGAYPTFNFHVAAAGGKLVTTPYVNDHEDPRTLIEFAKRERAKLLYFANPDNPMGSHWPAHEVQWLLDNVPDDCILILDEAYIEFAPDDTAPRLISPAPTCCVSAHSRKLTAWRVSVLVMLSGTTVSHLRSTKSETISKFHAWARQEQLPPSMIRIGWRR